MINISMAKQITRSVWRRIYIDLVAGFLMLLATIAATVYVVFTHDFQIAGTFVKRVDTDQKVVALTFDDGPRQAALNELLPTLKRTGTHATFYILGSEAAADPSMLVSIARDGHEIGNHGYTHLSLAFVGMHRIDQEVRLTNQVIRKSGYDGPITFRAPYGHKLFTLPIYLQSHGITSVSRDVPADQNIADSASAQTIADNAINGTRPGSIILLHTMYPINFKSRAAVPLIIKGLKDKGYRFVTVTELLSLRR